MVVEVIGSLTAIFVLAAVLLLAAGRYGLPVIPFYLVAGIVAGFVIAEEQLLDLAQWGIAFLVFLFGVEFDTADIRELGADSTVIAIVQLLVTGGAFYLVGLGLGLDGLNALYLAIAAALSSSLVSLGEANGRPDVTFERLRESIHFVEDLLAIVVVLCLSAFVYSAQPALEQLAVGIGLVLVGLFVRRYLFDRIASLADDIEIMMLVGVSFIIGFIALSELAGISIVVGAFAAGLAVSPEYPYNIKMLDAIEDLHDFFAPIFFLTLGALIAIPTLETALYTLVLVVAVLVVNPAIAVLVLLRRGYDPRTSTLAALGLDQVSEFSLIVAIGALGAGTIEGALFEAIVLAGVVTMIVSAYSSRYGEEIHRALAERGLFGPVQRVDERSRVTDDLSDHVIVVGYGTEGKEVARACEEAGREFVVIENDPVLVEGLVDDVENYVVGDVMGDRVWEAARADRAELIVSTVIQEERSARALELDTEADVITRATDEKSARELFERGALYVAVPDVLAAGRLAARIEAVLEADEDRREELRERSREKIESAQRPS
ncbi:cation:proton antiporter [Halalkalicoccus tibetensis]|uniref:Cation:proton antiporter n=1 Tax=Halalkalicoccus tibetensis TaxID=175632 RepID=A0ABD5V234_9EURY